MENLCREYLKNKSFRSEEEKKVLFSFAMKYGIITMDDIMNGFDMNKADKFIEQLKRYTYIDSLLERIRTDILSKYRHFLIEDIIKTYNDLKYDISLYFNEIINNKKKMLDASNGDIDEIKEKYKIACENAEIQKETKNALMVLLNDLKEHNRKRLEDLEENLASIID